MKGYPAISVADERRGGGVHGGDAEDEDEDGFSLI